MRAFSSGTSCLRYRSDLIAGLFWGEGEGVMEGTRGQADGVNGVKGWFWVGGFVERHALMGVRGHVPTRRSGWALRFFSWSIKCVCVFLWGRYLRLQ